MSASSTRVALAAVAVFLIGALALLGWRSATAPHPNGLGAQDPQRVAAAADKDAHAPVAHAQHAPASVAPPSGGPASADPASHEATSSPHASVPAAAPRADNAPAISLQRGRSEAEASEPPAAAAQPGAKEPPSFDIVRVEPNGDALLAGRSQPEADVALVAGGKVVARAKADTSGSFVMTPPTLRPGDYALSLREGDGAAARESKQNVVVSVPKSKQQQVVVALAEPGRPTRVLSAPPAAKTEPTPRLASPAAAATGTTAPKLAIRSVELENGSGLLASGTAPPGTGVRVYLNNSRVADVTAPADGAWSLTVRRGLAGGHYAVRADSLEPNRSVGSRVEVPFDVPATMSAAPVSSGGKGIAEVPRGDVHAAAGSVADAQPIAPPAVVSPSAAVVDDLKTTLVSRGDNLWRISRKQFGRGKRYTQIYAANAAQIRDPALIYPGQVFVLPTP